MKDLLLRNCTVIDPGGEHHEAEIDILISGNKIARIGTRLPKGGAREVLVPDLHVSLGWVDLRAHFRDPGEEWKEGLLNGLDAAAAGGFTHVAVLPSTDPVLDSRAGIEYVQRKAAGHAVRVLPLGALTKGLKGEQLAELYDMQQAGAVAFTDDQHAVRNTRLMLLALQYCRNFDGTVISFANDADLGAGTMMHEGHMSVRLGMRGLPAMAETIALQRDLSLLEYTGGRLHVATISTAGSVGLIRAAKAKKLRVTCSVAAHNLLLDDGCLRGFDTLYKVLPPMRDREHIDALREGLKDGTIDTVVSDHRPEDVEHKKLEFGQAAFGAIGLETAFAVANTALKAHMSVRRIIERFSHGPRAVLGLPVEHIAVGAVADLTLFDPECDWTFGEGDIVSRSHNTPFIGQHLVGRPLGIVANGKAVLAKGALQGA
ncbi:MAG: dihydroorotase [Flavobacteriales bacterium]